MRELVPRSHHHRARLRQPTRRKPQDYLRARSTAQFRRHRGSRTTMA